MVVSLERRLIGVGSVIPQVNNQLSLEISIDKDQIDKIVTHSIDGKEYIGITVNAFTLKELLDGSRSFVYVHHCPEHKINKEIPAIPIV